MDRRNNYSKPKNLLMYIGTNGYCSDRLVNQNVNLPVHRNSRHQVCLRDLDDGFFGKFIKWLPSMCVCKTVIVDKLSISYVIPSNNASFTFLLYFTLLFNN